MENGIALTKEECISNISAKRHATEEEFQNFMHRVTEVEKIVKKLASDDAKEQEFGMLLADEILDKKVEKEVSENLELKIKSNRTIINKYPAKDLDPNEMSQEAFKQSVERDAQARAEDRKARYERAETYKRIGNSAFQQGNYAKAITYFTKAIEQRKDSALLWNNRAISYIKFGLYKKALHDCEWALKVNDKNIKALLNSAKCHKLLNNDGKSKEFLELAYERNPQHRNYILDFEKELQSHGSTEPTRMINNSVD